VNRDLESASGLIRAGEWLFRGRGWLPVPLLVVTIWMARLTIWMVVAGLVLILVGLTLRLWSVAHIGPASRTRGDEVHKLVYTGPYELSRNPLYVANLILYGGAGLLCGDLRWLGILVFIMSLHYYCVVRWEEWNLERRLGEVYRSYLNRVPRWLGSAAPVHAASPSESVDTRWSRAWRSERSTLLAVGVLLAAIFIRGGLAGA